MLFACILVPNFPVQVFLRANPGMREHPVGILEGVPPQQRVIAVNTKAAAIGVDVGFTKQQAEGFGAKLFARSDAIEGSAHTALLDCASKFSPRIQDKAADTLILDIDGLGGLFGSTQQIAAKMRQALLNEGFHSHIAVANNPDTAVIAAQGFSGATVITDARQLSELPLAVLHPDPGLLEITELWGILTLGQLATLDSVAISQRLGEQGLTLQRMARGRQVSMFVPYEPKPSFHESAQLEHPIELLETLCFVLGELLERICAQLQEYSYRTNKLELELVLDPPRIAGEEVPEDKLVHRRSITLSTPMLDPRHLVRLLELDLQAHPPSAAVVKVAIVAEAVEPKQIQQSLFALPQPEPQRLQVTIARLKNLMGETEVGCPTILNSHHPSAFHITAFAPPPDDRDRISFSNGRQIIALRLFDTPKQAHIAFRSGTPVEVRFDGRCGRVINCAGPSLVSGEWWSDNAWSRKEGDVNLRFADGLVERYLIYLDLIAKRAFVHGSYD